MTAKAAAAAVEEATGTPADSLDRGHCSMEHVMNAISSKGGCNMRAKRIGSMVIFLIAIITVGVQAQTKGGPFICAGYHMNYYLGEGEGYNIFSPGHGINAELGLRNPKTRFGMVLWGISYSKQNNTVKNSVVSSSFFSPYYTELRYYIKVKKLIFFLLAGYEYNRVGFANAEGKDDQHLFSGGGGINVPLAKSLFAAAKLKTYIIFGNSLEQKIGFCVQVNIGIG